MAAQSPRAIYASNGLEIDLSRRELRRRGISVPIGSRAFEILELLVRSGGELVDKYHIMDSIWPGAIVEENTLQFHISALRKALGTDRSLLKTASGRGYRLLGQWTVREVTALQHRPDPPVEPRQPFRTNVPIAGSALIGRSMPRQQLLNVLSAYRVVTLTGPGGIGKSVLALAVARNLFPTLDGDCWLVELASLSDPTLVPSAVASVLGLRMGGNDISAASVARAIGSEKLLLVLDNCEHLADAAASLAEALVRLCPNVSILATSREILRIEGEYVYRVPSLDVPPRNPADVASIGAYSAVRLFAARLTTLDSGFSSRPEDLPLIAAICKRLDGIPLAIEFAAARAATLGLQQVADRLNDRFNLLTGGRRTALPRHLTLRATLDWSHELLTEPERLLLRRLAVFASTFSLEAVGAVVASVESASPEVVDSLSSLVAKSLVVAEINATTPRYRLLDTTRAYAFEKLAESGERERLARRHAEYYRDLFERAEAELEMRPTVDWLDDYGRHIDDIRAALDWSFSSAGDTSIGLAITVAAVPLWMQASLMEESRRRIEQALGSLASQTTWDKRREMQLLTAWGVSLLLTRGGAAEMNAAWTSALRIAEELDDTDYRLRALWGLYIDHLTRGDYRTALACAERFHQLTASAAESTDRFMGERMIGTALHMLGNQNDARRHFEQMLGLHLAPDYRPNVTRFPFDQRAQGRSFFLESCGCKASPTRPCSSWPATSTLREQTTIRLGSSLC